MGTRAIISNSDERLIIGEVSESAQKVFYDAYRQWLIDNHIVFYYFEAFDENWKGGQHPDEVEKHWGLYQADRTPKPAMSILEPLP